MSDAESKVKAKLEWLRQVEEGKCGTGPDDYDGHWMQRDVAASHFNALIDIAEACLAIVEEMHDQERDSLYRMRDKLDALGDLPNE